MAMTRGAFGFLFAVGFWLIVVLVLHFFFGMGVTTAWLTFLAFLILSALAATDKDLHDKLDSIERKLDAILKPE